MIQLTVNLLKAFKADQDPKELILQLKEVDLNALHESLPTDHHKKAFWVNLYNAFIIHIGLTHGHMIERNPYTFFNKKWINVGGTALSFDDIEHGLLRKSQLSFGMGYLPKLNISKFEKSFRVKKLDPRIHFALNCGAKSCPSINYYTAQKIENQLQAGTTSYLNAYHQYDEKKNKLKVSRLFLWFMGDFGGYHGIRRFHQEFNIIAAHQKPAIKFLSYDWQLKLGDFIE